VGYVIDTTLGEEERSARIRFVGDSPYRSEEEDPRALRLTGPELQEQIRAAARARGRFTWWTALSCGLIRRHVFVDFEVQSTAEHFVLCARCFKVSRTYREEGT